MSGNEVDIDVKATDSTSSVLGTIGKAFDTTVSKIGDAVGNLGKTIGGELGEVVSKAGEAIKSLGDEGTNIGTKMAAAGAGIAGLGLALGALGSSEAQAEAQLKAAVDATGASFEDYKSQIDAAVSKGEDFGHSASDVDQALQNLTLATNDTQVALNYMGLVADLAAAKHESMAAAASQVAKVLGGNTKLLRQYGIDLDGATASASDLQNGLTQLGDKLQGQAAAAADTFMGKIDALKEHMTSWVARIANDVSPTLTFLGTALGIVGSFYDIVAARELRAADADLTKAASSEVAATAQSTQLVTTQTLSESLVALHQAELNAAIANEQLGSGALLTSAALDKESASADAASASAGKSKVASAAATGGLLIFAAAAYEGGKALGNYVDANNAMAHASDNSAKNVQSFTQALQADSGVIGVNTQKMIIATLQADKFKASTDGSGVSLKDMTGAITDNRDTFNTLVGSWVQGKQISGNQAVALVELKNQFDKTQKSTSEANSALAQLNDTAQANPADVKAAASAIGTLADEATGAKDATTSLHDALQSLLNPAEDTQKAMLQVGDNIQSLADQVKQAKDGGDKFAASLDATTASGRKNQEAILSSIDSINDFIAKAAEQGQTADQIKAQVDKMNQSLLDTAGKAGIGKQGLQDLINQYESNPKTLAYTLTLDATQWLAQSSNIQASIGYLNQLKITNPDVYKALSTPEKPGSQYQYAHGGAYGGAATGGSRNGVITWAEHGQEMAKLPNGSYVFSNPDTERMLAASQGGAGGTVTVVLQVEGSGDLTELIRKSVRIRGGGDVQAAFGSGSRG